MCIRDSPPPHRKISPILEDHTTPPVAFYPTTTSIKLDTKSRSNDFSKTRSSIAKLDGLADSTVERAVARITDMGFSEAQAKYALKKTDMGDGLRVDRAVDLLLRA